MLVHARTRSLLVQADPAVIMAAVPAHEVAGPNFNVAVKHTPAATLKLREMGLQAPSPIMSYYDWPKYKGRFEPFDHQKIMAEFMTLHRRCFNLGEMGVGKSAATLWALDFLMNEGVIDKALIVCPLSIMESVWLQGVMETVTHRRAVVLHGDRAKRMRLLSQDADIYIINHEGLTITPVREMVKRRRDIDQVVVDEGSRFRNARTDRYRCLEQVVSRLGIGLWWLTGTPCPTGPDNAWAQCRLVDPAKVPRFFGSFRAKVMVEVAENIWKPRQGHQSVVHAAMQPAIRFAKADCLDLPPLTVERMACEMSAEQADAFRQMANAMQVAHKNGDIVTAANAGDRINKLRQILLGSIKVGPTEYLTLDYKPRFRLLLEAIEQAAAKVVVVVPFKGITLDLHERLARHHTAEIVNGDVPLARRNRIFAEFKTAKDPRVLLCHPEVMSHGLNLTEADVLVFFGPIYSNDNYRQVVERLNRPPQARKMTVVQIGCHPIEWAIYRALDSDEVQQQLILELYRQVIEGD